MTDVRTPPLFSPTPTHPEQALRLLATAVPSPVLTPVPSPSPVSGRPVSPVLSDGLRPSVTPPLVPRRRRVSDEWVNQGLPPFVPPTRFGKIKASLSSDRVVAVACGVATGTALYFGAHALLQTAAPLYKKVLFGAAGGLLTTGVVALVPQLPYRLFGMAFGALAGAALAITCAPCMSSLYLAGVTVVSAAFGYKASQHAEAIKTALFVGATAAAVWWAATVVAHRLEIDLPEFSFST